jgi:hypothetical protein
MRKHCLLTAIVSIPALGLALAQQPNPPAQNPAASNAQTQDQLDAKTRKTMDDAAKKGHPLTVVGAVRDKVSVEAVLLPYDVSRHVFGREVADSYAAVEITVSNHSTDASLIVHTVYIDYSQWALSGYIYLKQARDAQLARAKKAAEQDKNTTGAAASANQQPLQTETTIYEAETKANQIASVEYRAVRGQALDAQPWTKRNITIRALRLAGSIASAYSFVTRDQDIVHGITAFAGQVVPGAETFWPDGTVEQLNRISDLGFKVNKVIPKNASDVIVAFFPLDRFLTPGLKVMFKKSPALFFAPYALAFDHEARKQFRPIFTDFLGSPEAADAFLREMPLVYMCDYLHIVNATELTHEIVSTCLEKIHRELPTAAAQGQATPAPPTPTPARGQATTATPTPTATPAQTENLLSNEDQLVTTVMKFLSHASLNTVRVVVGGDYTVNVNDIPAMVNAVELDGGPAAWNSSGDKTGILRGSFLTTGAPQIVEADKLGISNLVATDATSDSILKFKMTLKNGLTPGTSMTFRVDKTNDETKKTVQGVPLPFQVPKLVEGTELSLANALANDDATVNVKGANFSDNTTVLLFANAANASDPTKADFKLKKGDAGVKSVSSSEIVIDLCQVKSFDFDKTWTVKVQDGAQIAPLSPTFKPSAAAKNKCKSAGGGGTTQPQTTTGTGTQSGGTQPTTASPPPPKRRNPNGNGQPKKTGQ